MMIAGPVTPRPPEPIKTQNIVQPIKPVVPIPYAVVDYRRPPGQRLDVKI